MDEHFNKSEFSYEDLPLAERITDNIQERYSKIKLYTNQKSSGYEALLYSKIDPNVYIGTYHREIEELSEIDPNSADAEEKFSAIVQKFQEEREALSHKS